MPHFEPDDDALSELLCELYELLVEPKTASAPVAVHALIWKILSEHVDFMVRKYQLARNPFSRGDPDARKAVCDHVSEEIEGALRNHDSELWRRVMEEPDAFRKFVEELVARPLEH